MRTSKRVLAGVAAGALGAAALTLVAAAPAQAASAASIDASFSSFTIIIDGQAATTTIYNPYTVTDSDGEEMSGSLGSNREVRVSIDAPATAAVDDSIYVGNTATFTGTTWTATSTTTLALAGFKPSGNWSTLTSNVGTYTVTANLVNTANGAILDSVAYPVNVATYAAGDKPAAILWANGTSATANNLIGALGQVKDDSASTVYPVLIDSGFGPFIIKASDDTLAVSSTSSTGTWGSVANGFTSYNGSTSSAGSGVKWASNKTSGTITATFTNVDGESVSGTLGANLAAYDQTAVASMAVTSKAVLVDDTVWEVPADATSVSFDIDLTDDSTGTVGWNSLASGGLLATTTPSGGAASVTSGSGSATVSVSGDVSAEGESLWISSQAAAGGAFSKLNAEMQVNFVAAANTLTVGTPIGKVSTAVALPGSITDQWGDPLTGSWALSLIASSGTCGTATVLASTTANAAGEFSLTVPASSALSTPGSTTFKVCASNGYESLNTTATVYYTASGGVNSLTLTGSVGDGTTDDLAVIAAPATPTVTLGDITGTSSALDDVDQAAANSAGTVLDVAVSVDPTIADVTVTAPSGVYLSTSAATSIAVSAGKSEITVGNGDTFFVFATKPGLHAISASAGTTTEDLNLYVGVNSNNGRVISVTEAPSSMKPKTFTTVKGKVADIFGNPVPGNSVTASTAGDITLSSTSLTTDADGVFETLVTAGDAEGTARVTFVDDSTVSGTYAGYPAQVDEVYKDITISSAASKSIVIVGERGTVSGKPGILVEGDTTGFATGDTVKPWVRFPGGEYTLGAARPAIDAAGGFSWSRKTGKKSYVYFTSDDEGTVSNRVIIAAK